MQTKRKGITLIEALFVLGIMAILIGMVMLLFSQNNSKVKQNQTVQEYSMIQDSVKTLCNDNPVACNNLDLTSTIANSGLISNKYIKNNTIVDPYGSQITSIYLLTTNNTYYISLSTDLSNLQKCMAVTNYEMLGNPIAWRSSANPLTGAFGDTSVTTPNRIEEVCNLGISNNVLLDY